MKSNRIYLATLTAALIGLSGASASVFAGDNGQMAQRAVISEEKPNSDVAIGWSVKKSLLGKTVYDENEEKIGVINDLLIGPDSTVSHVVVDASTYLGADRKEVAIDANALQVHDGKFYVQGAAEEHAKATGKGEDRKSAWL